MTVLSETEVPFALCLTHDVDRPYKTPFHAAYYAVLERDLGHLRAVRERANPYWQFDRIMAIEEDFDVRSAFYFLSERPLREHDRRRLLDPDTLVQAPGRYDVRRGQMPALLDRLDDRGWEVGLHGSLYSADDRARLRAETRRIERVLGHEIRGGRQHYLDLSVPETWEHYRSLGLSYDASFGSRTNCGFQYGYDVYRPFDDEFAVFPLTLMEQHLPNPDDDFDAAWAVCESLLDRAAANDAVMTTLFHPRYFSERDFPGYADIYRRLLHVARDRDAWVGSPAEFYRAFLGTDDELPVSKH